MLLGAGGYLYSLGHNSAAPTTEDAPKPSMVSTVAKAGAGWIAREVHEQTAWAAESRDAPAPVQPTPQPQYAPVAAEFAEPQPVALPIAPAAARRGLQVIIEPASAS